MGSILFIIDPLYTVWMFGGCVVALFAREKAQAQLSLLAGLALSTAYLGWSLLAKALIDELKKTVPTAIQNPTPAPGKSATPKQQPAKTR